MSGKGRYLFTSESVTEGHPDKIADQISDSILDAILAQDPVGRVACETLVTTGLAIVAGEITTSCYVDFPSIVRETIREVGYTRGKYGFDSETCAVLSSIHGQSPDIAQGVDPGGAGDQGLMFGYACTETPELMPMPIMLAHKLVQRPVRAPARQLDGLPPARRQVAGLDRIRQRPPVRVDTIVVSTQHSPTVTNDTLREDITEKIVNKVIPKEMMDGKTRVLINPTGRFVVGGPHGDAGVTGRKIIVDTYGGAAPHGGGAFSGKDPTKVDRSACYMARYVAKNVVAAGLAEKCMVQLAYAIGVAEPVSVYIETAGTGTIPDEKISELVRAHFKLTPRGIIESLDLRRPIYKKTAAFGHFGRTEPEFTWERTDKAAALRADARYGRRKQCRLTTDDDGKTAGIRPVAIVIEIRLSWTLVALSQPASFCFVALPPRPARMDAPVGGTRGAHGRRRVSHPHDPLRRPRRSHAVAAAAARAGLKFVILTDHGDGTRPPDPPEYIDGVLVLDGVEISTDEGHYVAIDMPRAPYPLGGAADAVVEDVRRLGGFGIAAHPDSPKPALRWTTTARRSTASSG